MAKLHVNQENLSLPPATQKTTNLTECYGESEGNISSTHYRVQVLCMGGCSHVILILECDYDERLCNC